MLPGKPALFARSPTFMNFLRYQAHGAEADKYRIARTSMHYRTCSYASRESSHGTSLLIHTRLQAHLLTVVIFDKA